MRRILLRHGTGGVAATLRELKKALPDNAVVMDAFDVYRADIMQAQPKVHDWLRALGFAE